jgi:hypothetical protein
MIELIDAEGMPFERQNDANALRIAHHGEDADWSCITEVWEDDRVFACYSVSPLRATPDTMAAAGEFVHLVNVGVLVGNFELDLDDGEIRFKTTVGFGPTPWSDDLARVVLYTNLAAMNMYAGPLLRVVSGADTPAEALAGLQ